MAQGEVAQGEVAQREVAPGYLPQLEVAARDFAVYQLTEDDGAAAARRRDLRRGWGDTGGVMRVRRRGWIQDIDKERAVGVTWVQRVRSVFVTRA